MLTKGRHMLFTDVDQITDSNIIQVLNKAFCEHEWNVLEEMYLFDYVAGDQPILQRKKEIREEINERW